MIDGGGSAEYSAQRHSRREMLRLPAAALAGAMLAASFPPLAWGSLAWFALVPLLWSLAGARPRQAAGRGYVAGLVFFMAGVGLFTTSFGNGVLWMTVLPWFVFSAIEAVWFIPLGIGVSIVLKRVSPAGRSRAAWPVLVGVPALWVMVEWGRGSGTYGFPFGGLAAATVAAPTTQWASVGGCYLVSGIVALAGTTIYLVALGGVQSRRTGLVGLAALVPLSAWGFLAAARDRPDGAAITVRIGQGASNAAWDSAEADDAFEALRTATLTPGEHPDLVVWSESAIPSALFSDPRRLQRTTDVAAELNAPFLTGAIIFAPDGAPTNCAVLFRPDRSVAGTYRKRQLVPFGEFVPLRRVLPFLGDFGVVDRDEVPGTAYTVLRYGDLVIGAPICFESASPRASRAFANAGANILVVITNDGWFGGTGMADQHLNEARLRAIETHRWVIRCAHSGISAIISPTGAIERRLPLGIPGLLTAHVGLQSGHTPFVAFGNWFVIACAASAVLALWSKMGMHTPPS